MTLQQKQTHTLSVLRETKSICHQCDRIVDASIIDEQGVLYLRKYCPEHGTVDILHFLEETRYFTETSRFFGRQGHDPLDNRAVLVLDLTYECNLDCKFCYAEANERNAYVPSIKELLRIVDNFKGSHIYLGGGEPTVREDLSEIIRVLKQKKFTVVLMTNGVKLQEEIYVESLKAAGLDYIQVQFDSMDDEHYVRLTGDRLLSVKLKAIENIKRAGIPIYLWAKLVAGINDDQVVPLVRFAAENSRWVKYLILVDVWIEGRGAFKERSITRREIMGVLQKEWGIHWDDFIRFMEFDYYLFEVFNILRKRFLIRSTPCASRCHCFYTDGNVVPFSRMIDFDPVNKALGHCMRRVRKMRNHAWQCIALLLFFPYAQFIKAFLRNAYVRRYMIRNARFLNPFYEKLLLNQNEDSFTLVIGPYMDTYNFDAELAFANCHMPVVDAEGRCVPFCLNEILRGKRISDPAYIESLMPGKKLL